MVSERRRTITMLHCLSREKLIQASSQNQRTWNLKNVLVGSGLTGMTSLPWTNSSVPYKSFVSKVTTHSKMINSEERHDIRTDFVGILTMKPVKMFDGVAVLMMLVIFMQANLILYLLINHSEDHRKKCEVSESGSY